MVNKIIGFVFLVLGSLILFKGPDISDYQPSKFTNTIMLFGIILIVLGIYLIKL